MLLHLWDDFRYAARRLRVSPGFAAAAVLTIALGVGINTGIFSVLNGLALRELPAPDADELVSIHQIIEGEGIQRFVSGAHQPMRETQKPTELTNYETSFAARFSASLEQQ